MQIGDAGSIALARAVSCSEALQRLNLNSNSPVTSVTVAAFAKAVPTALNLRELCLACLSPEDALVLLLRAVEGSYLQMLDLRGTQLTSRVGIFELGLRLGLGLG